MSVRALCRVALTGVVLGAQAACLSFGHEPTRRYYVLNTDRPTNPKEPLFPGLVRVRDLDAESAYDRFQLVVRKNPFELTYRERDVWAVKPNRMIADILAHTLAADNVFAGVTRELSERRPHYLFSGEIHAIEIIDRKAEGWAVRLAMSLTLSHAVAGTTLWSFRFERTQDVPRRDFSSCVEVLSQLTADAMSQTASALRRLPAHDLATWPAPHEPAPRIAP